MTSVDQVGRASISARSGRVAIPVASGGRSISARSSALALAVASGSAAFSVPAPPLATEPAIVGSTAATTPLTESQDQSGNTVVIPVPPGVLTGDRLYAVVHWAGSPIVLPAGWEIIQGSLGRLVTRKSVGDGDPSEYTWTGPNNASRSGCMLAVRGGVEGNQTSVVADFVIPDVEAVSEEPILLGSCFATGGATPDDDMTASAPLVLQAQHSSHGSAAYAAAVSTGIAVEDAEPGVLSGRSFAAPNETARVAGLVLEVG